LIAVSATAELITFGRVNTPKSNTRPVNFERVAVNDAGLPGEIVGKRWRSANAYRRKDELGRHESSERQFERPNPFSANVLMLCKRICIA
jgi:hypothetical protein